MSAIDQRHMDCVGVASAVYVGEIPLRASDARAGFYQSRCSSAQEDFAIRDAAKTLSTGLLSEPRHIAMFAMKSHAAAVVDELLEIHLDSAPRAMVCIFRSARRVERSCFSGSLPEFAKLKPPSHSLTGRAPRVPPVVRFR